MREKGIRVFGDWGLFYDWLTTKNESIGNVMPITLEEEEIDNLLDDLSCGNYM